MPNIDLRALLDTLIGAFVLGLGIGLGLIVVATPFAIAIMIGSST